jgi:uncharacterized membrane protein (UPF0127 family)
MRMGSFVIFIAMLACACGGGPSGPGEQPDDPGAVLPTAEITVSGGTTTEDLIVELATTPTQWAQGLMNRPTMAENRGMIFLFPVERSGGFWMQNTLIPLDIAYLSAEGEVLSIAHGKPLDTTILDPGLVYRHVLEVNGGWFERHGLGVGSKVSIPVEHVPRDQAPGPAPTPTLAR